jgi:hypothetical protein
MVIGSAMALHTLKQNCSTAPHTNLHVAFVAKQLCALGALVITHAMMHCPQVNLRNPSKHNKDISPAFLNSC